MGCAYSADRKPEVMKGRIQPIDSDVRVAAGAVRGYDSTQNRDQPKYVNNLRGVSIKSPYPKDDVIPGFT
jgi:hypothetical protein